MRIIRIYQEGHYQPGDHLTLSAQASQHVAVVLRLQIGAALELFNGDNFIYSAELTAVTKKTVKVRVLTKQEVNRESPCRIHLAQAVSKGERMEWVIQKATELGVASITPIISAYCMVRLDEARWQKKIQQWQAIAISACEQSGRNWVPSIVPSMDFNAYLTSCTTLKRFILDPLASQSWRAHTFPVSEIALLIGPEGGFSPAEIVQASAANFVPLSLGPRVLRTETAALTALSLLQAVSGDL